MNEQNKNVPINSDINKGLFSFTIKKKKDSNALQESSIAENVAEEKEKTEFIVGIHENKIERFTLCLALLSSTGRLIGRSCTRIFYLNSFNVSTVGIGQL